MLAAVAVAVLIAAHLVARRRRRLVVSTADAWSPAQAPPRARLGWRIQRWLTFLLHVSMALLLVAALADPRPVGRGRGGRSIAILIDASASMGTRLAGQTRLEVARSRARALAATLEPQDEAMVASFGRQVDLESVLTRDRNTVLSAIERIEVGTQTEDLETAVAGAADLLRGRPDPRIVVIGDRAPRPGHPEPPPEPGRRGPRVPVRGRTGCQCRYRGVFAASIGRRRRSAGGLVDPAGFGRRNRPARASIWCRYRASGACKAGKSTSRPGSARSLRLLLPAGDARAISAILREPPPGPANSLASDDRALAVTPAIPNRRVLLVSEGNLYLEGALRSFGPGLIVRRVRPDELGARWADSTAYDVVIFDGVAPSPAPTVGRYLYLDPSGPGSPFPDRGQVRDPVPTELRRDHPLLRHVALADLNIREARRLAVRPGDVVVAAALGVPLIVAREQPGLRLCALGFDLRRSDLPLRPTLPLLLANALDWLAGPSVAGPRLVRPLPHPSDRDRYVVERKGRADPRPTSSSRIQPSAPLRSRPAGLFLLLAFALGLAEWWAHQRRWTTS